MPTKTDSDSALGTHRVPEVELQSAPPSPLNDTQTILNNKYLDLLYIRGYLFSTVEIKPPIAAWQHRSLGSYHLYFDPENQCSLVQEGENRVAILGKAVDILNWTIDLDSIALSCLKKLLLSEESLLDYIDYLSGRFILIYQLGNTTKFMTDAFGMRSAFYSLKHPVMIASHCNILSNYLNSNESKLISIITHDPQWKGDTRHSCPGNLTPFEGIYILTPNTLINIEEKAIKRFYPRKDLPAGNLSDVVKEVSVILTHQMELLNSKHKLAVSLSAGIDSRTTLAASKNLSKKPLFFTYETKPQDAAGSIDRQTHGIDVNTARDIASFFCLNHVCLDENAIEDDLDYQQFVQILNNNSYHAHRNKTAKSYLDQLPSGLLHIRSNISEIGRAFYQKNGFELPLTAEKMAKAWKRMEKNQNVVKIFSQFAVHTKFDKLLNYDPYDMFYWEHRMGTWHSLLLLESDVAFDTHILFNCRVLAEKMLSLPTEMRISSEIHRNIIKNLWPELLFWPVNELPYIQQVEILNQNQKLLTAKLKREQSNLKKALLYTNQLEAELKTIKRSFSYRLGNILVQAVHKPGRNSILLPCRLFRLFRLKTKTKTDNSKNKLISSR